MAALKLVVPKGTTPGTPQNITAAISVARYRAATIDHDARPLAYCLRDLREGRAHESWLTDEPRTWARFCEEALGYDAAFLDAVEAGVRILEGDGVEGRIPGADAYAAGDLVLAAAHHTTGEVLTVGGDQKSEARSIGPRPIDSQAVRAARFGISPRSQRRLDRLAARFPDLMKQVRAGEISASEADRLASGNPRRVMVTLEAGRLAQELRARLTQEQLRELVVLLTEAG